MDGILPYQDQIRYAHRDSVTGNQPSYLGIFSVIDSMLFMLGEEVALARVNE